MSEKDSMQFNVQDEARQKMTRKGMQQLAEFYKARQRALMNAHLAQWNTHQQDKCGQPRPPVDDETTYTVDEEILQILTQVGAKREVGRTPHNYGVEQIGDGLQLRTAYLINADMTLVQVHQLMKRAVGHLEEKLRQDPSNYGNHLGARANL